MFVLFEISSWMGKENYLYEGDDVDTVVEKVLRDNDIRCIARMGRSMGPKSDQPQLDMVDKFLKKYDCGELTWDDLSKFELKISTGGQRCVGIASKPVEVEKLKQLAKYSR